MKCSNTINQQFQLYNLWKKIHFFPKPADQGVCLNCQDNRNHQGAQRASCWLSLTFSGCTQSYVVMRRKIMTPCNFTYSCCPDTSLRGNLSGKMVSFSIIH